MMCSLYRSSLLFNKHMVCCFRDRRMRNRSRALLSVSGPAAFVGHKAARMQQYGVRSYHQNNYILLVVLTELCRAATAIAVAFADLALMSPFFSVPHDIYTVRNLILALTYTMRGSASAYSDTSHGPRALGLQVVPSSRRLRLTRNAEGLLLGHFGSCEQRSGHLGKTASARHQSPNSKALTS